MKRLARAVMFIEERDDMSPVKNELVQMIDCLPETELSLLLEIARRFIPDDAATPDDLTAIMDKLEAGALETKRLCARSSTSAS